MAKTKKATTKKKTTTKKTNTKKILKSSKEMLQPGARGHIINGSGIPGYRGQ